jgi:hypothetical protein
MAEIKSTLDLIMERTKNLIMTDQEKTDLHLKELQGKVNGFTQRFMDGLIDIQAIEEGLFSKQVDRKTILDMLRKEALNHIDPDENNERAFRLLQGIFEEDLQPLSNQIDAFKKDRQQEMARHVHTSLKALLDRGIRGSAVMPNLEKDQAWQTWLGSSKASFKKALNFETDHDGGK